MKGVEYVHEYKHDVEGNIIEENIYRKVDGKLIPVDPDEEVWEEVRNLVEIYDQKHSF